MIDATQFELLKTDEKLKNFAKQFPKKHTPVDYVSIHCIEMYGPNIGVIIMRVHGMNHTNSLVILKGDAAAMVPRIKTPNYDLCRVVANPRAAAGGSKPHAGMMECRRLALRKRTELSTDQKS